MWQGRREPCFDPNDPLLNAGESCFEAINARFAHLQAPSDAAIETPDQEHRTLQFDQIFGGEEGVHGLAAQGSLLRPLPAVGAFPA
jgi:hypothetical protein